MYKNIGFMGCCGKTRARVNAQEIGNIPVPIEVVYRKHCSQILI